MLLLSTPGTPPVITSSLSASATQGVPFSYQITATNSPTSFNATGLPGGLSVNTSTGFITGTPTTVAVSTVSISATNASGTGSANLTLSVFAPGVGTPFITGVTAGSPRTDSYQAGFALTVGATPLTLTHLGRYANGVTGHTHTITVYDRGTLVAIPGATAVIDTTGATPGTFVYAPVSGTPVLWDGYQYIIGDTEGTGDTWYNDDTVVSTTADATLTNSEYYNTSFGYFTPGAGGTNHPYVPVNFKYTIGAPGGITVSGTIFVSPMGGDSVAQPNLAESPILTGNAAALSVAWIHGPSPGAGEAITYQWMMDDYVPISPVLVDNPAFGLPYTWDTTSVADGTHVIWPNVLDSTHTVFERTTIGVPVIVANSGFNNGTQTVPVLPYTSNRGLSPIPDFITYTAGNPHPARDPHPFPYTFIKGANDPTSPFHADPTQLRDELIWWGEFWVGPRNTQYHGFPQWVTTPSGGIYSQGYDPNPGASTAQVYSTIVIQNSMDGPRFNSIVSPFSNYVEDPAGGGKWWGAEVGGRVFNITHDGTVTTIVGKTRDKSQPTIDPHWPGINETIIAPKVLVRGNFPVEFDSLGGANDLCFDPRDSNILYVCCQIDNFIARVNLTTLNLTLYAGTPGTPGYTGDGGLAGAATFSAPMSIIMDATGIMYVADFNNSAIRKILPGSGISAGNISTLCGGTVGVTPPVDLTGGTSYNVTSITWNSSTNTGVVVMAASGPTGIVLGSSLELSGATNVGGSTDPNTNHSANNIPRYVVTAFSDDHHFTVGFERSINPFFIGSIGGSPVFTVLKVDLYSAPGTVPFSAASLCGINSLRFNSTGDIIFAETNSKAVRWVHLGASTISRVNCYENHISLEGAGEWIWIAVDTAGTCGPVDDILVFSFHRFQRTWRMGLTDGYSSQAWSDGWALNCSAPVEELTGGMGHYPWAIAISTKEGRMITTGGAMFQPNFMRIKQSSDPNVDHNTGVNYYGPAIERGGTIFETGTAVGFPRGVRPSFEALTGFITNNPGANTSDDWNLTYPTDAAFAAFIQSGMGGSVPRPEIVGTQMRDLIYALRRSTLAGSLGPTPVQPGPADTNTTGVVILTCSAVRDSVTPSTKIIVTWTTDIPSLGMVAVWAPGQRALGTMPSIFSRLESSFTGGAGVTHSMPCQVLAGVSPVHYVVVCESEHGIFSHTIDQMVI
jgi:hypothetical protein